MKSFKSIFPDEPVISLEISNTIWAIRDAHCTDPSCEDCRVDIKLVPDGDIFEAIDFRLDLTNGDALFAEDLDDQKQAVVLEVVQDREVIRALIRRKMLVKAWSLLQEKNPAKIDHEDYMYAFEDFTDQRGTTLIPLEHAGDDYGAIDQYCLKASCKCNNVGVQFFDMSKIDRMLFQADFVITSKSVTLGKDQDLSPKQEGIVESFMGLKSFLVKRRNMMHQLGAQRLLHSEPVRVEKNPGRNDPCSCGSGKKFKKCCGR